MCPSCRLPMVGTRPMRLFSWRARARAARSWAMECNVFMVSELVLGRGEFGSFHRADIRGDGRGDICLASHEVLHEARQATADRQAEHVVHHQHLTISTAAGANADDRNAHGTGNGIGELAGYTFEQQHG